MQNICTTKWPRNVMMSLLQTIVSNHNNSQLFTIIHNYYPANNLTLTEEKLNCY